jgi:hypothetical protein
MDPVDFNGLPDFLTLNAISVCFYTGGIVMSGTIIETSKFPVELPSWTIARNLIIPCIDVVNQNEDSLPARRSSDVLVSRLTDKIKMTLALFYDGMFIPLSEYILRSWDVSFAIVRLAMEENMYRIMGQSQLEEHRNAATIYYTLHHPISVFNSVLPFFRHFQIQFSAMVGFPYYMVLPEKTTAVFFSQEKLGSYARFLRDDIFLTYDCSTQSLSTELIEVSADGLISVCD